jgi:hypothetical protein
MSQSRVQKLNALLKRVEERRAHPRLRAVAAPAAAAAQAAPSAQTARAATPAPTREPSVVSALPSAPPPTLAPAASLPPAAASARAEPAAAAEASRRGPSSSPLEDAMAEFGANREDSGPLSIEPLSSPIHTHTLERPSMPEPLVNQDLVLTHRPAAGSLPGPLVEFVQPKPHAHREPTLRFDTGVKANPLMEREVKPEPAPELNDAPLNAPSQKLEPQPLGGHAAPVRVVSSARQESAKTFGELLELSLALRPAAR